VIHALIHEGKYLPEKRSNVSILFCDFVGFTSISATLSPEKLFDELTEIFTAFDDICFELGGTRIKTIGDAYMAATGVLDQDPEHATRMVHIGLRFIQYLEQRNAGQALQWNCRIGVHSGSVIAGIVGKTRFIYDVMGDDVNIAARVESAGTSMRVTITDYTASIIANDFIIEPVGQVMLKGKGEMMLHRVVSSR
jgi:class 3 adenylate cyclase